MPNADQKGQREAPNSECGTWNVECGIRTVTVQSAAEFAVRNAESARGDAEFRILQKYEPALRGISKSS